METGEVRVLRLVSSHDIGRAINPKLVESQQFGGAVMGLGYGLYEEAEFDRKTGVLLNADVHQYRMPDVARDPGHRDAERRGRGRLLPLLGQAGRARRRWSA